MLCLCCYQGSYQGCESFPESLQFALCAAALIGALAEPCKEKVGVDIVLHTRPKGEDGSAQITELLDAVSKSADTPVLGLIQKVTHLLVYSEECSQCEIFIAWTSLPLAWS